MKRCIKCNKVKTLTEFHKYSKNKDGLKTYCKTCIKKDGAKYRYENKVAVNTKKKKWYNDTKLKASERTLAELEKNIKQCTNCKEIKELSLFRKRANGGFYATCKTCENIKNKLYVKNNPTIIKRIKQNTEQRRQSKKRLLSDDFTIKQWKKCKEHFNNQCAYCGIEKANLTQEHVVPVVNDGGYTKSNIVPACRSCNAKKHSKEMIVWYKGNPFFSQKRLDKIMDYLKLK